MQCLPYETVVSVSA